MISRAIQYLFPHADPLRDYQVRDDGDGPYIAAWDLPYPEPTVEQLESAYRAALAADAIHERSHGRIHSLAHSVVGLHVSRLDQSQVRALLAVVLLRLGGLDEAGNVKPLTEWEG